MADQEVIIDVQANTSDAVANIVKFRAENEKLKESTKTAKDELRELEKAIKEQGGATVEQSKKVDELNKTIEENTQTQKLNNKAIADNQKAVADNIAQTMLQEGSIQQMRKSVASLTSQWENLSQEEREGAKGQEMQQKLADLNTKINEASMSTKNFKDNIGNYRESIAGLITSNTEAGKAFGALGIDANMTAKTLSGSVVNGLNSVGKSMTALLANPLFLVIAGITAILVSIYKAIEKNQAAMDAFQKVGAPVGYMLEKIFDLLGKIAGYIGKVLVGFMDFIGLSENEAVKAIDLRKQMEEEEMDMIRSRAEEERRIAELQDMQVQKQKYTHEERIRMAEEIKAIREKQAEEDERRIKQQIEMWHLENDHTDISRESAKELAELEAKLIQAQTNRLKVTKEQTAIINEAQTAQKAELNAQIKANEQLLQARAERLKKQAELEQKSAKELEEMLVDIMAEGQEKEIAQHKINSQKKIDAIKHTLETETLLTIEASNNLNAQLLILEEQQQAGIEAIKQKYKDAENEAERLAQEEKTAVEMQQQADAAALRIEQRRAELNNDLLLEVEMAQAKHTALVGLDEAARAAQFTSKEAYELAVLQSSKNLEKAHQNVSNAAFKAAQNQAVAVASIAGAMGSMLSELAGQSKSASGFSKALALVDIATNMGVGIAGAIKAGAGVPFPVNLAAIASGVAAVTTGIASAKRALSSDSPEIPANLSKGASTTSVPMPSITMPTLPSAGVDAGAVGEIINIEHQTKVSDAMRESTPTPVVSVVDIIDAIDSVAVKEDSAQS